MPAAEPSLSRHLLDCRDAIIEKFLVELQLRGLTPRGLSHSLLRDSLPRFFEEVARELTRTERQSLPDQYLPSAKEHGIERSRQGFNLRTLVREYGVLQHVILKDLEERRIQPSLAELEGLLNCINTGIAEAVAAHTTEADELRAELTQKERLLDTNQLRLRMITESIPQIVWTAQGDGTIDWCNENWFEFTGLSRETPLAETWMCAIHPEDREEAIQRWRAAVATGTPYEIEYRILRSDGTYRWFLGRASPVVDSNGALLQWFGTCTDIDDQKQTETRLRAATAESEHLNRLKDEFLATVSHELRTPLQSILGWARLLRAGHVSAEKSQKALETIERNAKAQSQLIEDILDVSRIITGKARIRSEPVDVTAVLGAALDTTQPAARAKGVELSAEIASDVGVLVGDADRLQQVVWNLLSNAVKFTPPGGHVRLRAHRSESGVRIVVEDDGQGIPAHFLAYVFDRFRQADGGPQRAQGGLGLGLAIVRHLVELHGGTVSVASAGDGRGATFAVELPPRGQRASSSPVPIPFGKRSDPAFPAAGALTGVRVLVVDDEPDARELISAILQQYGAIVSDAQSSEEALGILESGSFDVLVSDIGMPREDGYALMRRIRARSDRPDLVALRAVALTAYARQEDQRLAREAGYQRHVAKPVEPAHLVSAVIRLARS